jgi:MYXO-CTERM domain-containing protein
VTFAASGGSGAGYVWSFASNVTHGTIANGVYVAGRNPGTDVVTVSDGLGNSATAQVVVTAPPNPGAGFGSDVDLLPESEAQDSDALQGGGGCSVTQAHGRASLAAALIALVVLLQARRRAGVRCRSGSRSGELPPSP